MSVASAPIFDSSEPEEVQAPKPRHEFSDRWLLIFVGIGFCFELGLFVAGDTALRLPLRVGMYLTSLAFVFLIRGQAFPHPGSRVIQYILAVLAICLINPLGNNVIARVAQIGLYFSVLA